MLHRATFWTFIITEHIEWWKRYVWWWSTSLLLSFDLMRIKKERCWTENAFIIVVRSYPTLKYAHSFHFVCLPVLFAVNSQYLWTNIQAIFALSVSLLCTKSNMFHVNEDKMFDACPYASSSPKARQIERWVDRLVHLVFTSLIFSVRVNQKCFFNVVSYSISWFFLILKKF